MGAVAIFVASDFVARYPEFENVSPATLNAYFSEATVYLKNDGTGPVSDANKQKTMLWQLTAHIAELAKPENIRFVGRVGSAGQGSESASAVFALQAGSMAWFNQTQYGAAYWALSKQYRRFAYAPPRVGPWQR